MTKSRVDEIVEKGLKKLEVWYKVHTKKKHSKNKSSDSNKGSEEKTTSTNTSSDVYRSSINLNQFRK